MTNQRCAPGLLLLFLLITTSIARATDQTITLGAGAGSTLVLARPFKTVLIGDPKVVDVLTYGDRLVVLEPLNPGATDIIFIDEKSIVIRNVRVVVRKSGATRISYQARPDCGYGDVKENPGHTHGSH